jgi:hypothetical protein
MSEHDDLDGMIVDIAPSDTAELHCPDEGEIEKRERSRLILAITTAQRKTLVNGLDEVLGIHRALRAGLA